MYTEVEIYNSYSTYNDALHHMINQGVKHLGLKTINDLPNGDFRIIYNNRCNNKVNHKVLYVDSIRKIMFEINNNN